MESITQTADSQMLPDGLKFKRQELMEAKAAVDEATQQLKSESFQSLVPIFFYFIRCYYVSDLRNSLQELWIALKISQGKQGILKMRKMS